jgi:hypothetical protein
MRCGAKSVVLVEADGGGTILSASAYEMDFNSEIDILTEEWLHAFAKAVALIPKKIRKRVQLVIPPNNEVFVRHVHIPDVTEKSAGEAFRFECEREFVGGNADWCFDIYHMNGRINHAFAMAIHKTFLDRIVDILLRNGVHFSYVCPEILLNTIALNGCVEAPMNSMLVHIGATSSYVSCIGSDAEYFRTLPISGMVLNRTICDARKVSAARADELQLEFLGQGDSENRVFMTYYAKQFAQKLRQEIKKSELFYCRTFGQNPIGRLYLTGSRCGLYRYFKTEDDVELIEMFDSMKGRIGGGVTAGEIDILRDNIGTFIGAANCLRENRKDVLNLFAVDFSDQVEFQRQHVSYLLILVVISLLTLAGLKILKKDVIDLSTKRDMLSARMLEIDVDVARYAEVLREKTESHEFIKNAKLTIASQVAWAGILNELQAKIKALRMAWIDSLSWNTKKDGNGRDKISLVVKMFVVDDAAKSAANERISDFIESLGDGAIGTIENVKMLQANKYVLSFSFDIAIREQSGIFLK